MNISLTNQSEEDYVLMYAHRILSFSILGAQRQLLCLRRVCHAHLGENTRRAGRFLRFEYE